MGYLILLQLRKLDKNLGTSRMPTSKVEHIKGGPTCGLNYKPVTIIIYDHNDSGLYYKTTVFYNPS
jgi:hypothetical protein